MKGSLTKAINTSICTILLSGCTNMNPILGEKTEKYSIHNKTRKKVKSLESKNLILNDDDQILYVTKKNEKNGILDIKEIIHSSPFEDSWIYLPEKEFWFEIGVGRSTELYDNGKYQTTTHTLMSTKRKVLNSYNDISQVILYHNHPSIKHMRADIKKLKQQNKITKEDTALVIQNYISNITTAYEPNDKKLLLEVFKDAPQAKPSFYDINAMISDTYRFRKIEKDIDVKHKICSEFGITTYYLTTEGIEHFKDRKRYSKECLEDYIVIQDDMNNTIIGSDFIQIEFEPYNYKPITPTTL